ncbi:tetratricopeptide repeat protein [Clostridium oryzae]|uniref:Tetratricopeptide repeat protein n=1 Tax=Clostridium oryzae TaxID=1450648 RepID=A0A1V4IC61_9CLOT|nr:UPF0489 family protein [Clostridium oryzae]OPJ57444.1 tetratricopeptide repeat protein [Clostridium oryzae]
MSKKIKIKVVQRHSTAFIEWIKNTVMNSTIIHIDAHSDFYGVPKKKSKEFDSFIEKDSIYMTAEGDYDIGSYLSIVIETGIASKIVWVRQDFDPSNEKLEEIMYESFMSNGEGVWEFNWKGFNNENKIATAIINGVIWDFCSFENIKWNIYESIVIDIDADYFMFYRKNMRNELIRDILKRCNEHVSDKYDFIILSISFEGGFISYDFKQHIMDLFKECNSSYDIQLVTEPQIHPELNMEFRKRYNCALYLLRSGECTESNYEFLSLLNQYNWIPGVHYNIALTYRILNNYHESERFYKSALTVNPNLYMAINDLGTLYLNAGRLMKALDLYEKEIDKYDMYSDINYNMGMAYYMLRDLEKALDKFTVATNLQQINYKYSYMKAITLKELNQTKEANKILRDILNLPIQNKFRKLVNDSIE